jgi:DNA-binding NtrC family response regulator
MSGNILIIEDDHEMSEELAEVLKAENYLVDTVCDGKWAISLMSDSYDFVLLDLKLAGVSGYDVLKHVKENHSETRVIILTGDPSVDSSTEFNDIIRPNTAKKEILELADAIFSKPFDVLALLKKMHYLSSVD